MEHSKHTSHTDMQSMQHEAPANSIHMMHTQNLRTRFIVCLVLTVPILLLSLAIQMWFQFTLTVPYQPYILLALAIVIYAYGGWPFLRGLVMELKQRQPGMMTLIGTAISVAFFFSAATVFAPVGSDFFLGTRHLDRHHAAWALAGS